MNQETRRKKLPLESIKGLTSKFDGQSNENFDTCNIFSDQVGFPNKFVKCKTFSQHQVRSYYCL